MHLPGFLSIIHTYFHRPTFIFKTTNPNNMLLLPNPLFDNSKQLTTITTRINFLHRFSSFLIHSHMHSSISIFFASQYFFLPSSFRLLFCIPKQLSLSTRSHIHIFIPPPRFKMLRFAFSITIDFTRNI